MGLIQKLNYLYETKELIKAAITAKGVVITDTMPFRQYAAAIDSISSNIAVNGGYGVTSTMAVYNNAELLHNTTLPIGTVDINFKGV